LSVRLRLAAVAAPLMLLAACGGGGSPHVTTPPPATWTQPSPAPGRASPWVTEKDGRFVDAAGRQVFLRGVDVAVGNPNVYELAPQLHVNFVRIVAPWSEFEPRAPTHGVHHWDMSELHQLDQEVRFFRRARINVLIDFHQFHWSPYFVGHHCAATGQCTARGIPAWFYANGRFPDSGSGQRAAEAAFWTTERHASQDDYAAFAAMMARRYAGYPNVVGYEIINEPPPGDLGAESEKATQTMLRWQVPIRNVLRTVDPGRTVFVMCNGGGQGVGGAQIGPIFGNLDHLALDFHDYYNGAPGTGFDSSGNWWVPSWAGTHNQKTTAYTGSLENQRAVLTVAVDRTRHWKIPLLVGEWGIHSGTPGSAAYQSQMLSLFDQYGVSYARWELSAGGGFGLYTGSGAITPEAVQLSSALAANPARS
jgi:endoglycosylceramidase